MATSADPKRLIELLRIAGRGSFTRAAQARGVSQPALSNSMAVLEKMLGVRVFERTRNGEFAAFLKRDRDSAAILIDEYMK